MKRPTWIVIGVSTVLLLAMAYFVTSVVVYTTVAYVCEATGSRFGYLLWPGGLKTGFWSRKSSIETYLDNANLNRPVQHRWSRCAFMGTTILGKHISFSDGPVGGILLVPDAQLHAWIEHHTRDEILALYEFLLTAPLEMTKKRTQAIQQEAGSYS